MPYVSLNSANYPNRYIRHQNFLGELTPISSELDKQDATFEWTNNFTYGAEGRLRSLNYPSYYLRHQDFRIKLNYFNPFIPPGVQETPAQKLLREDTSFILVPGLSEPNNRSAYSFRSKNYPDRYIRHRNFHLYLEPADSELAKKDATFYRQQPLAAIPQTPILRSMYCPMIQYCPYMNRFPYFY